MLLTQCIFLTRNVNNNQGLALFVSIRVRVPHQPLPKTSSPPPHVIRIIPQATPHQSQPTTTKALNRSPQQPPNNQPTTANHRNPDRRSGQATPLSPPRSINQSTPTIAKRYQKRKCPPSSRARPSAQRPVPTHPPAPPSWRHPASAPSP
jgi:hypothetical protein